MIEADAVTEAAELDSSCLAAGVQLLRDMNLPNFSRTRAN